MSTKTKDQGITEDRKDADDAAETNDSGGVKNCECCCGSECHIEEWTDD